MREKTRQLTAHIPERLYRKLKERAWKEDTTMTQIVTGWAEEKLK